MYMMGLAEKEKRERLTGGVCACKNNVDHLQTPFEGGGGEFDLGSSGLILTKTDTKRHSRDATSDFLNADD